MDHSRNEHRNHSPPQSPARWPWSWWIPWATAFVMGGAWRGGQAAHRRRYRWPEFDVSQHRGAGRTFQARRPRLGSEPPRHRHVCAGRADKPGCQDHLPRCSRLRDGQLPCWSCAAWRRKPRRPGRADDRTDANPGHHARGRWAQVAQTGGQRTGMPWRPTSVHLEIARHRLPACGADFTGLMEAHWAAPVIPARAPQSQRRPNRWYDGGTAASMAMARGRSVGVTPSLDDRPDGRPPAAIRTHRATANEAQARRRLSGKRSS